MKKMKTIVIRKLLLIIPAVVIVAITMSFTLNNAKKPSALINADKEILTVINVITPKEGDQEKIYQSNRQNIFCFNVFNASIKQDYKF